MKTLKTFKVKIYVGLQEGYNGDVHPIGDVELVCREYCDAVGLAVTVTPTKFIYTGGSEDGCIVGLINYPRFPDTQESIKIHSINIAKILMERLNQKRISIVCTDETTLLEHGDD